MKNKSSDIDSAADTALSLWKKGRPIEKEHPYLARKNVSPTPTLRELDVGEITSLIGYPPKSGHVPLQGRVILVPVKIGSALSTVEMIDEAGRKTALAGGRKQGGFWASCKSTLPDAGELSTFFVGEGVATVLTVTQACGGIGVATLSCGNLVPVATFLHRTYPDALVVILCDLVKLSGAPNEKAVDAARAVGGFLAVPDFGPDRREQDTDFIDLSRVKGVYAVMASIAAASAVPEEAVPPPSVPPFLAEYDLLHPVAATESAIQAQNRMLEAAVKQHAEALPYPIDALPDVIRAAVIEVQAFVQAPMAMVAASALSAASIAAQQYHDVEKLDGKTGPVSLYLMTVAQPSERKTTCDSFFMAPLRDHERQQRIEHQSAIADAENTMSIWESKQAGIKDRIRQEAKKGKPIDIIADELRAHQRAKPAMPRIPRIFYTDTSPEALLHSLATKYPAGAIVAAEGGMVIGSHGMSKDSITRNLAMLNGLWDGTYLQVDRRTSESFCVSGARFTMAIQVQEGAIRRFFDFADGLARDIGFLSRFLFAHPESTQGTRLYREPPQHWPALSAFASRLAHILRHSPPIDDHGALHPEPLPLSSEARQAAISFHDAVEECLGQDGMFSDVRDIAGKITENAMRLATIFQLIEQVQDNAVTVRNMRDAIQIATWHMSESIRFLGLGKINKNAVNADKLLDYIQREAKKTDRLLKRHIQRNGPIADKVAFRDALDDLADRALITIAHIGRCIVVSPAKSTT